MYFFLILSLNVWLQNLLFITRFYDFSIQRCSVRRYLQLFVGELMSYLRHLWLFAHSDFQHILCCVFVLFFFVLLPVSLDCPFLIAPWVFSNVYLSKLVILWVMNQNQKQCLHFEYFEYKIKDMLWLRSYEIYLYIQCLSPPIMGNRIPSDDQDRTACVRVCKLLSADLQFSPVSFPTNKTKRHDITKLLMKVTLSPHNLKP